jgi:hypothetical protein
VGGKPLRNRVICVASLDAVNVVMAQAPAWDTIPIGKK